MSANEVVSNFVVTLSAPGGRRASRTLPFDFAQGDSLTTLILPHPLSEKTRYTPMVANRQNADDNYYNGRRNKRHIAFCAELIEQQIKTGSRKTRRCIHFLAVNDRDFVGHHIPYHSSHCSSKHTHNHRYFGPHAQMQRLFCSYQREKRYAEGVEQEECFSHPEQKFVKYKCGQNTQNNGVDDRDIADPYQRVTVEQDVAERTTADGRYECGEACPEPILVFLVFYSQRAGYGKGKCTDDL
jgi:hypothetical protein